MLRIKTKYILRANLQLGRLTENPILDRFKPQQESDEINILYILQCMNICNYLSRSRPIRAIC